MAVLAGLLLLISILGLLIRAIKRRPLRKWGIASLVCLAALGVFSGISEALYGGASTQQASAPSRQDSAQGQAVESTSEPTTTQEASSKEDTTAQVETTASSSKETTVASAPEEDQSSRAYDAVVNVSRVVDGDTIEISPSVEGNNTVRLIGVDTPETKDPDCGVQPYGKEASDFTSSKLSGQKVGLEFDVDKTDPYERLLAYVYASDGSMFNETLLTEGYGQVATFPPNVKYVDRFLADQEEARTAERGLWGLSAAELSQETDRGNNIGGGGCPKKATQPEQQNPEPSPSSPPQPTSSLTPTPALSGGGRHTCKDFATWAEAQAALPTNPQLGWGGRRNRVRELARSPQEKKTLVEGWQHAGRPILLAINKYHRLSGSGSLRILGGWG
jgi:micrococcal nuclease